MFHVVNNLRWTVQPSYIQASHNGMSKTKQKTVAAGTAHNDVTLKSTKKRHLSHGCRSREKPGQKRKSIP